MSLPFGFKDGRMFARIRFWRAAHRETFSGVQWFRLFGSLRNIPSPEQGASMRMRSKKFGSLANCLGSVWVTITFGFPQRVIFSASILALDWMTSLVMRMLPLGILAAMRVLFPPGAAHKSRMVSGFSCGIV